MPYIATSQSTLTLAQLRRSSSAYAAFLPPCVPAVMFGCDNSQISETETRTELWHPMCFNKKIALLGTFCVAPTTPEDDKDPNHLLPRLTFEVRS
jgi:hypothetical protein